LLIEGITGRLIQPSGGSGVRVGVPVGVGVDDGSTDPVLVGSASVTVGEGISVFITGIGVVAGEAIIVGVNSGVVVVTSVSVAEGITIQAASNPTTKIHTTKVSVFFDLIIYQ